MVGWKKISDSHLLESIVHIRDANYSERNLTKVGQTHYRTDTPSTQMEAEDMVRCEE
jgi:hypothetical protein